MELKPQIFDATVMHKRHFPIINQFVYKVYYLACPHKHLSQLKNGLKFAINRFGLLSYYDKDHINPDLILKEWGVNHLIHDILLVTMPRILGYGFNPVSFWLCLDQEKNLKCVIAEVHNTFGEKHCYICAHPNQKNIQKTEELLAQKVFHVSPFMERKGFYKFKFDLDTNKNKLGIWIDYYHENEKIHLSTSLLGKLIPWNAKNLRAMFFSRPLMTLKVITLIHWQAAKLWLKGISYIPKPQQKIEQTSSTLNLTKLSSDGNHPENHGNLG